MENSMEVLYTLKTDLPSDPPIPLLSIYGEKSNLKRYMHPNGYSSTIYNSQDWKQPTCPLTDELIKNMWYTHQFSSVTCLYWYLSIYACVLSHVLFFAVLWTVAGQALLFMDFPGMNTGGNAISSFRESSWPRDGTCVSCTLCTDRQILFHRATWENLSIYTISTFDYLNEVYTAILCN